MFRENKNILIHVPTEMKKWEDRMYDAEFEGEMHNSHEHKALHLHYKNIYLHYKSLHDRGIEYEPTF